MSIENNSSNPALGYAPDIHSDSSPDFHLNSVGSTKPIDISGNTIKWPDNGWYEVQSSASHQTIQEGGESATVEPGVYTVINHHTGERYEGIQVGGGADAPAWESLASSYTSAELLTQQTTTTHPPFAAASKPGHWPSTDGTQVNHAANQGPTTQGSGSTEESSFFSNTNLGSMLIPLPGPIALPPGVPMPGLQIDVTAPDGLDSMTEDVLVNGAIGAAAGFANGGGPAGALPWGLAGVASGVHGNLEIDAQIESSGGGLPPGPGTTHVQSLLGTENPQVTVGEDSATFTNPETGTSVTYGTNADGLPTQIMTNTGVGGGQPFAIVTTQTPSGISAQLVNDVTLNDDNGDGVTDSFTSSQADTSAASTPVTNTTVDVATGAETVSVTTPTGMTIGPAGTNGVNTGGNSSGDTGSDGSSSGGDGVNDGNASTSTSGNTDSGGTDSGGTSSSSTSTGGAGGYGGTGSSSASGGTDSANTSSGNTSSGGAGGYGGTGSSSASGGTD